MPDDLKKPLDRAHNYGVTPAMVMIALAAALVIGLAIGLLRG